MARAYHTMSGSPKPRLFLPPRNLLTEPVGGTTLLLRSLWWTEVNISLSAMSLCLYDQACVDEVPSVGAPPMVHASSLTDGIGYGTNAFELECPEE